MKKILTLLSALLLMGSMMVVKAVTYTPAGQPASVFGAEWAPNTPANDMTLSNGLYVYAKKANFSQTAIQFKVCKDHAWTTAYPGSNYSYTIPNGSKYLIITYNTSGNAVNAFAISSMTVAGDNATLFGGTWNTSNTANDMELQSNGTYKFEKSGVALSAGTVNFKACANHGWDNAWPSENYGLTIPESGNYTITITFDPATLTVSATADLEQAVVVIPNIQLHSNIKNPSWESTANFNIAGNNETASLTLTDVTKGSYEFGVKIDGTWTSNGSAFSRANPSHAIVSGSGNCTFNADVAGDYTFTWTYADNSLSITYPALPTYTVDFVGLENIYLVNNVVNFNATSTGVANPTYTYYVRKGDAAYGAAVTSYTFAEAGTYTVKVEVRENGAGDALKTEEQTITVDNPLTLYFVNKDAWANVKVYFFNPNKTDWPGDAMTATGEHTAFHNYAVYSYTVPASVYGSANVIFNNGSGSQTGDLSVNAKHYFYDGEWYATLAECDAPPTIKMHGNFLGEWNTTDPFVVAAGNATASLTLNIPAKGTKEFGMRIGSDDNWTSNGASISRASTSAVINSGSGNCSFNADIPGEYTFTWTYANNTLSITYPELPEQFVGFSGLNAEILKGTEVTFAATSSGITNPVYTYYVKPAGGEYGSAVASYTFDAEGSYTVKVSAEGDNTAAPVVDEQTVVVYDAHTFTAGTRIYVDFTAVSGDAKGVNYPKNYEEGYDYDANGAGTFKTIRFLNDVTWSTLNTFIKTEKGSWAELKFTVPGEGQNKIIVAADGASYTWGTYTPETVKIKIFAPRDETNTWNHVYAHSWDAAGDITSWPGTEITATKNNGWYEYDVQVGASLLFHDNAGMQTDDIENIQEAACYQPTAINYGADPKKVTLAIENDCEITYYIAGSTALVGGAVDFDTNAALDDNNQIVFHDVEPGTYAFKINNGTWAWSIAGEDHLKEGECSSIATTVGVGDLGFAIVEKQDITITYYPETQEICLGAVTVQTLPEIAIEQIGGKFIIDAKGDTAVFSRGNLQYHYGLNRWYCAEHQYDFLGEEANLQFGKEGYTGAIDLFGWSNSDSNYGRMLSNNDADYMNSTFVDWGGLFTGDKTWSTFNTSQMNYVIAHQKWTTLTLDPTPEDNENGDEITGLVLFPYDWVMPAGYEQIHYSLHDWNDEQGFADNTILPSAWDALEAAGAVFMPMAGARAGYWGCTWNGDHENTNSAAWNPAAANSFDHVDNVGWYGYYWLSTPDSRSNYQHCANYLIFPGWGEGPTLADDDDIYYPPQVWSREKRRGNSVRLVNIIPRQYTVTYTAGEGEGTVPTDENKYLDGAAVTLAAATGLSKEGYRFAGWKFKGQVYNDSYTVNNVLANEEIVFEAVWEEDWTEVRNGLTEGWYYTMCLDKAVTAVKGGTIWKVVSKSHNGANPDIILEEVDGTLDAGRPYIFNATAAELEVIYTGDAVLAPVTEDNNGLIGSFSQASITPNTTNYIIYNNALYYVNSDNVYVGANRAYLDMNAVPDYNPGSASAPGRRRITMTVHNEQNATGMENVQGDNVQCTKILINGQLFILRGEKLFDATGRLVK